MSNLFDQSSFHTMPEPSGGLQHFYYPGPGEEEGAVTVTASVGGPWPAAAPPQEVVTSSLSPPPSRLVVEVPTGRPTPSSPLPPTADEEQHARPFRSNFKSVMMMNCSDQPNSVSDSAAGRDGYYYSSYNYCGSDSELESLMLQDDVMNDYNYALNAADR